MTRKIEDEMGRGSRLFDNVTVPELMTNEATVDMPVNGPIRVLKIADLHAFGPDSSRAYIKHVFEELEKPDTYGVLLNDLIQGFNPSRSAMAAGVPRLDEQVLTMEAVLKKLGKKRKLIASVTGTDSHEGWSDTNMTFDLTYFIMRDVLGVDGKPLPRINNGGYVTLRFPNGGEYRMRLFHNPGGGGSPANPVGAQRKRAMEVTIDDPRSPDSVSGGHFHSRAAITTELLVNTVTGEVVSQTLDAGGTAQGIDDDHPNIFLTARGSAKSLPGLPTTILTSQGPKRIEKTDVWGLDNSGVALDAIRLWNTIESRGMGAEVEGLIRSQMKPTTARFMKDESRLVARGGEVADTSSQTYSLVRWNIDTDVPILNLYLGSARYGSSSTNERELKRALGVVETNPETFGIVLRGMVDKGLSLRMDRLGYLDKMVGVLEPAGRKQKIQTFLLDRRLREPGWKRDLGDVEKQMGDYSEAIMTGDFIQDRMPGVPLGVNTTFVYTDICGAEYRTWLRDKLGQNMSTDNPFGGLEAQRVKSRMSMDVTVGGHARGVGVMRTERGVVVAPGGYSRWAEQGEDNEEEVALGAQWTITYPGRKRILAGATLESAVDTHKAVFYAEGMKFLPKETVKRIVTLIPRRRR